MCINDRKDTVRKLPVESNLKSMWGGALSNSLLPKINSHPNSVVHSDPK